PRPAAKSNGSTRHSRSSCAPSVPPAAFPACKPCSTAGATTTTMNPTARTVDTVPSNSGTPNPLPPHNDPPITAITPSSPCAPARPAASNYGPGRSNSAQPGHTPPSSPSSTVSTSASSRPTGDRSATCASTPPGAIKDSGTHDRQRCLATPDNDVPAT